MKRFLLFLLVSILLLTCSLPPHGKDSYLSQYDCFMTKVKEAKGNPDTKWDEKDKEFKLYSQIYYNRFKTKLSFSEKVICKKHELEYFLIRTQIKARILGYVIFEDNKELSQELQNYGDNNLSNNMNSELKEVSNIKDKVVRTLKQILTVPGSINGSSTTP